MCCIGGHLQTTKLDMEKMFSTKEVQKILGPKCTREFLTELTRKQSVNNRKDYSDPLLVPDEISGSTYFYSFSNVVTLYIYLLFRRHSLFPRHFLKAIFQTSEKVKTYLEWANLPEGSVEEYNPFNIKYLHSLDKKKKDGIEWYLVVEANEDSSRCYLEAKGIDLKHGFKSQQIYWGIDGSELKTPKQMMKELDDDGALLSLRMKLGKINKKVLSRISHELV